MKKILLLLFFILAIWLWQHHVNTSTQNILPPKLQDLSSTPTPTPILKQTTEVTIAGKNYQVSWIKVNDLSHLFLYSNLPDKKTSAELKEKYSCENLINAGFYDKSNYHLGLFVTESKTLNSEITSSLFNGFFFITRAGLAGISNTTAAETNRVALQSGPLLWLDANPLVLKINNDEQARRIVILITPKKTAYFLAVYDQDSPLQGPYLEDLPNLLLQFQKNTDIAIDNALNLDGGSASAFYSNDVSLTEINPIGGFFCITK